MSEDKEWTPNLNPSYEEMLFILEKTDCPDMGAAVKDALNKFGREDFLNDPDFWGPPVTQIYNQICQSVDHAEQLGGGAGKPTLRESDWEELNNIREKYQDQ